MELRDTRPRAVSSARDVWDCALVGCNGSLGRDSDSRLVVVRCTTSLTLRALIGKKLLDRIEICVTDFVERLKNTARKR